MSYFSFHFSLGLRHLRLSFSGGMGQGTHVRFFSCAESEAAKCEQQQQFCTAKNYRTAIRSFCRFTGSPALSLADITADRMASYVQWLRQQGVSLNTTVCYVKALRAIYNKVLRQCHAVDTRPFERLYTGQVRTEKRSVPDADISRLRGLPLRQDSPLALARDIFLFCLYAQGMPFVDAAHLRRSHISGGMIAYERHKTGQRVVVRVEPCMQAIIDRYAGANSDFVFPILTTHDPRQSYRQYQSRLRAYNRHLRRLQKMVRLDSNITSYVVRHTWATLAYDSNVDLAVISSALGHTNPGTTRIYIRDIDNRRLAEANHKVLKRIR